MDRTPIKEEDYFLEHEGKLYARVSSIASLNKSFSMIDPQVFALKTRLGTVVHEAIELFFKGEINCYPENEKCQGYFKGFLKWAKTFKPQPICQEKRVFDDKLRITGKCDLLATTNCSEIPVVIDFKTTAAEDSDCWSIQGFFYQYLLSQEHPEIDKESVCFVWLSPRGDFKVRVFKCNEQLKTRARERYRAFFQKYGHILNLEKQDDTF